MAKKKKEATEKAVLSVKEHNDAQKKESDHPIFDKVYFWVIDRYTKNNHKFTFSDAFIWKGGVYVLPEIFGYLIFFGIFLWLAHISFTYYSEARTIVFFILLAVWRLNMINTQLKKINKKLGTDPSLMGKVLEK